MLRRFRFTLVLSYLFSLAFYLSSMFGLLTPLFASLDSNSGAIIWQEAKTGEINKILAVCRSFADNIISDSILTVKGTATRAANKVNVYYRELDKLTGFIMQSNRSLPFPTALRVASALKYYSKKYNLPLELAVAVAYTESRFIPRALSGYVAAGLMQVVWRVHSHLLAANGIPSESSLFEPELGAAAGCLLLSRYIKASGSLQTALGRYYGGPSEIYWERISRAMEYYRRYK